MITKIKLPDDMTPAFLEGLREAGGGRAIEAINGFMRDNGGGDLYKVLYAGGHAFVVRKGYRSLNENVFAVRLADAQVFPDGMNIRVGPQA